MVSSKKKSKKDKEKYEKKVVKPVRKPEEIDISEHFLVPKHILLNEEEKKELLNKLGLNEKNYMMYLPKIKASDPAIKKLGAKPGDIIKIIRPSQISGESIYYRVVKED